MLTQPQEYLGQTQKAHQGLQLEYAVSTHIEAPVERIWTLLTQAEHYPEWNSTIVSLKGEIRLQGQLELVSTIAPKQSFKLKVVELNAPYSMVWQSGQPPFFSGRRSYTLSPQPSYVLFTMRENFKGLLLPVIAKSLPDFRKNFEQFAADLKQVAEKQKKSTSGDVE